MITVALLLSGSNKCIVGTGGSRSGRDRHDTPVFDLRTDSCTCLIQKFAGRGRGYNYSTLSVGSLHKTWKYLQVTCGSSIMQPLPPFLWQGFLHPPIQKFCETLSSIVTYTALLVKAGACKHGTTSLCLLLPTSPPEAAGSWGLGIRTRLFVLHFQETDSV